MQMVGLFGPKRHSDRTGDVSEATIIARLLRSGYVVLTPYGKQHRYDLVIEDADGQFWRVQCKTAWIEQDGACIQFNTASSHYSYVNSKSMGFTKDKIIGGKLSTLLCTVRLWIKCTLSRWIMLVSQQ